MVKKVHIPAAPHRNGPCFEVRVMYQQMQDSRNLESCIKVLTPLRLKVGWRLHFRMPPQDFSFEYLGRLYI